MSAWAYMRIRAESATVTGTEVVTVTPSAVAVTVSEADPAATAVMRPVVSTLATAGLLLV